MLELTNWLVPKLGNGCARAMHKNERSHAAENHLGANGARRAVVNAISQLEGLMVLSELGVVSLSLHTIVPERLIEQQQGSVDVEDMLKFIVSTDTFRDAKSMELLDIWAAVDRNGATVRSADETFGAPVQKSLIEKSEGPVHLEVNKQ